MKQRVSRNAKVISISMLLSSAIIAGGIAYASGDAFTACVNKKTGLTRIISGKMKCYKSERQVTWNQTGPTGSQGATGATGASGYSTVYVNTGSEGAARVTNTSQSTSVLSIANVPAGNYLLALSAQLDKDTVDRNGNEIASTRSSYIDCTITSASTWAARTDANSVFPVKSNTQSGVLRTVFLKKTDTDAGHGLHLAATGTVTLSATTTLYFLCNYEDDQVDGLDGEDGVTIRYPSLTLTKVNEVVRP